MDNPIGTRLDGRYEILELAGIGGMSDIYRARDIKQNHTVAVKILRQEYAESEDFRRKFRNESKAIAVLGHSNIVKVFDVGFTDNVNYIVMEYIEGITLAKYIEQTGGALKWREAAGYTAQVLRALQHAHDNGIVHRDIKTQNVMLLPDKTVKVMDFGIARFNRELDKTMSEKAIGSVHYISPEQARGENTDEKSDIYSTGIMLYEMLTGKKPFESDTPLKVAMMHLRDDAKRPKLINKSIPDGMEEITLKAMQKEPAKRYMTAGEMINDIEAVRRNPNTVFEYKYFSDHTNTKYFDKVGRTMESGSGGKKSNIQNPRGGYSYDAGGSLDGDDIVTSHRSPILPIMFAVAAVFVIMTAIFIYFVLSQSLNPGSGFGGGETTMPNLVGSTMDYAKVTYPNLDIDPTGNQEWSADYPKGVIMDQAIKAGRSIKSNQRVQVTVSLGSHKITLEDYTNWYIDDVELALTKQNLICTRKYLPNKDVPKDCVVKTDPPAMEMVDEKSNVLVYVSLGMVGEKTTVPEFTSMALTEAEQLARDNGVAITVVTVENEDVTAGQVFEQSVAAGSSVDYDTEVQLKVSKGAAEVKSFSIPMRAAASKTGNFTFEYYIDGELQNDLTKTVDVGLKKTLDWTVDGTDVHRYAIYVSSPETGKRTLYAEYEVDFTGDSPTYKMIQRNKFALTEVSKSDEADTETDAPATPEAGEEATESAPPYIASETETEPTRFPEIPTTDAADDGTTRYPTPMDEFEPDEV